jgi:hypothetical protein
MTPIAIALAVFVLANVVLAIASGVRSGGDTGMYLDGASALMNGQPLSVRQPSYAGYIAVIAFFQGIGAGLAGVVVAQLIAASAAAVVVAKLAGELSGTLAAVMAVLLFAVDFDTNRWHAFLLSDSLYMSALTIAAWLVYRAGVPSVSLRAVAIAIVAMLVASLIRPEGWFVLPAAAAFWIARANMAPARRWAIAALFLASAGVMVALVAPRLSGNLTAVGPASMLQQGQTIWEFNGWRVAMPGDPVWDDGVASAGDAVTYALRHPISTVTLMAARLGVHFAHVRPYFSAAHNAVIVAWLTPLYLLAGVTAWRMRRHALTQWCALVIATQTLVVALTHADWDGRYLSHMLPLMYPFAAAGGARLIARTLGREPLGAVHA